MLNKVILMGRLTSDPEHKQTQNGISYTRFSIAVQRNFADKNGNREADFINIVAWRQTADFICRFFAKGRMIAVEGSLQTSSYDDKNTGAKRYSTEVIVDQAHFADSKPEGNNQGNYGNSFPVPEPPPERNENYGGSNSSYSNNNSSNNNNNNDYNKPANSNPNPSLESNSGGYSVGNFFEASETDDDDFPY